MKRPASCPLCGALPWDCNCGDARSVVAHTPEGYPVNPHGEVLMHLCTRQQRLDIYEKLIPRVAFARAQAC